MISNPFIYKKQSISIWENILPVLDQIQLEENL
jgi:hypothetical protein